MVLKGKVKLFLLISFLSHLERIEWEWPVLKYSIYRISRILISFSHLLLLRSENPKVLKQDGIHRRKIELFGRPEKDLNISRDLNTLRNTNLNFDWSNSKKRSPSHTSTTFLTRSTT